MRCICLGTRDTPSRMHGLATVLVMVFPFLVHAVSVSACDDGGHVRCRFWWWEKLVCEWWLVSMICRAYGILLPCDR